MDEVKVLDFNPKGLKRARNAASRAMIDLEKLPNEASPEVVAWFARIAREKVADLSKAINEIERLA